MFCDRCVCIFFFIRIWQESFNFIRPTLRFVVLPILAARSHPAVPTKDQCLLIIFESLPFVYTGFVKVACIDFFVDFHELSQFDVNN